MPDGWTVLVACFWGAILGAVVGAALVGAGNLLGAALQAWGVR